jgi:histidyl-tRNA synthetase
VSKKDRIEPKRLKGFRDYLPDQMAERMRIVDVIRAEARLAGFHAIATPALEYAASLLGAGSDETDKQVYRFKDNGERDVALRFDLTVPFARFVAEHLNDLAFPFKRLQIGEVWRGENTQKGRYREFTQCDLDIIGVDSAAADIEILAVFHRILGQVGGLRYTMAVGNRVLLSALIRKALPGTDETAALIAIDKLAKVGPAAVCDLLGGGEGAEALLSVISRKNAAGDTDLAQLRSFLAEDELALREADRLEGVLVTTRGLAAGGDAAGRIVLDLSIARGLGYYTGIVFETTLDELPGFGSICSGGRYNNLASRFSARDLPGIGASIGLDRLMAALEELDRIPKATGGLVFVAVASDDALGYAFSLVRRLREAGVACDVALQPKLANQFKHADRLGCPYVVTVGGSEADKGTYALKNMKTGEERRDLPEVGLVDEVKRVVQ